MMTVVMMSLTDFVNFPGGIYVVRVHIQAGQGYLQQILSLYLVDSHNVCIAPLNVLVIIFQFFCLLLLLFSG